MNTGETDKMKLTGYENFIHENRIRVNRYLNTILYFFAITGPAIALGIYAGIFPRAGYGTCVGVSIIMLVMATLHRAFLRFYPDSVATSIFALVALDGVLVYMAVNHISIYITWFLVPLIAILFADIGIYFFAVLMNLALMIITTWIISPYMASFKGNGETPVQYFLDSVGGFMIETVIMVISGYVIAYICIGYFRDLIGKNDEIAEADRRMKEKMNILDSMVEIYDNVNLINFNNSTEMSLRDKDQVEKGIDMSRQSHTIMNQRLKATVMPDQTEDFLNFTNITTVRARLSHKKIISADFIDLIKGWFRAQYITVDSTLDGIPNVVIYTTRNIDDEKRREEHLIRISLTDELTRLYNRRCYEEDISVFRENGLSEDFVLYSIDVNGLKKANDTKGHAAGDELIKGAADCLVACVGRAGKAYRTGGDEFLAVVHTTEPESIVRQIEEKTSKWHGVYVDELSMSVGYAAVSDHPGAGIDELEKAADESMYEAKDRYYVQNGIERRRH